MGATVTTRRADCNPPSSFSRRQIPFAAASSSLAELSTRIDVARPIFRKNTGAHVAVKRRMRPIARPRGLHVRYDAKWHQWRITIRPTNSARSTQFVEPDQSDLGRPVLFAKIFRFTFDPNHLHIPRHPGPHKGAFRDRHGRRVGMRWTRAALLTRALTSRTAKSCGPDAPTLASSW